MPEYLKKLFETDNAGIIFKFNHLGVACFTRRNLTVRWILNVPTGIARFNILYSVYPLVNSFHTPEASCSNTAVSVLLSFLKSDPLIPISANISVNKNVITH